ncbi:MAG: NAD(P)-dependent oxidoreductase [Pseudomonadota bacterium]
MRVGFIGLGGIGLPMARNILRAGFDLTVHDLRDEPVTELCDHGATAGQSAKEVAAASDIVLASLPSNDASRQVVSGADGVLTGARAGMIYVELSTISPDVVHWIVDQMSQVGVDVLDAPVSGGIVQREEGTLSIMAGGKLDVLEQARPVLQAFGKRIFHTGDNGTGATVKLINNLLAGINMVSAMEAMSLATKAGLGIDVLKEVVSASSGNSGVFQSVVENVMERAVEPAPGQVPHQGLHTIGKDVRLAADLATDLSVQLPIGSPAAQIFLTGLERGWSNREYWSIMQILEEMSDVEVRPQHLRERV